MTDHAQIITVELNVRHIPVIGTFDCRCLDVDSGKDLIIKNVESVSYTHLDVYKRQHLNNDNQMFQ